MPATVKVKLVDPKNISGRLYSQLDKLLTRLESEDDEWITTPQLINAIKMVAQVMILQANLKAKDIDDPTNPGSAVRKYATAFKTNAARGRAVAAGGRRGDNIIALLAESTDDDGTDDDD